jgi:hypothetical protein
MTRTLTISAALALVALFVLLSGCGGERDVPADAVRAAIADTIHARGDTLVLADSRSGKPLVVRFDHVHETVDPTPGGRYVACVDYMGPDGTVYDVDYYLGDREGTFQLEDVVLHKVDDENVIPEAERARLDSQP